MIPNEGMLNRDIIFHSLYFLFLLLISIEPKLYLSHHIIHLSVVQAFYDFFSFQSIARNNFFYSVFFSTTFINIPPYGHNDTMHPDNLFFSTLTSFILMENKPDSHNISVVWHFGKGTWLKFSRGRLVNLSKLFYFSYPQLYKMRKLDWIISKIADIF